MLPSIMNGKNSIPPSVVKRMTKYLAFVQGLVEEGVEWISSSELADTLGLTSSTVRQDLSHLDFCGTSKRGYETSGLAAVLVRALGADTVWQAVVVGAGNLGRALALHDDFEARGFRICGIFDCDRRKIGTRVGSLSIMGMGDLPAFVKKNDVQIGVISVPVSAAQSVADVLITSKVKGLLNLALTHIIAPQNVAVVDARIAASLLELSYSIKNMQENGG
jgi:redox-sensing transcriptional repressor